MIEKLLGDPEAEVRSEAIFQITKIGAHSTPKKIVEKHFVPISTNLVTDSSIHVKAMLAECISKIAEIVGTEDSINHLVPVVV